MVFLHEKCTGKIVNTGKSQGILPQVERGHPVVFYRFLKIKVRREM